MGKDAAAWSRLHQFGSYTAKARKVSVKQRCAGSWRTTNVIAYLAGLGPTWTNSDKYATRRRRPATA